MNFGYSVGDFIAVGQLAWRVYKSCKDAPGSFKNISAEVLSLHAVLREVEETLSSSPLPQSKQASLVTITNGCQDTLQGLQSLVAEYESLGLQTKRTRDRLRWHSNDIAELRARLTSNTVLLTAFISTSQIAVERKLNKFMQELKDGKHEPSVITTQTIESLSLDEQRTWRNIRKELEEIGISVAAFDANKNFIMEWFMQAIRTGAFEEQILEDDSNSILPEDDVDQQFGGSDDSNSILHEEDMGQSLEGSEDSTGRQYTTDGVSCPASRSAVLEDPNQLETHNTPTERSQKPLPLAQNFSSKVIAEATPRPTRPVSTQRRPPRIAALFCWNIL